MSQFHAEDRDDDEMTPVENCPHCKAEVYDGVDMCPHCGEFILDDDQDALAGKPKWFVLLGLLGVIAVLLVLSGALDWL